MASGRTGESGAPLEEGYASAGCMVEESCSDRAASAGMDVVWTMDVTLFNLPI